MRDYIELRAIEVGKYIIDSKATVGRRLQSLELVNRRYIRI